MMLLEGMNIGDLSKAYNNNFCISKVTAIILIVHAITPTIIILNPDKLMGRLNSDILIPFWGAIIDFCLLYPD